MLEIDTNSLSQEIQMAISQFGDTIFGRPSKEEICDLLIKQARAIINTYELDCKLDDSDLKNQLKDNMSDQELFDIGREWIYTIFGDVEV